MEIMMGSVASLNFRSLILLLLVLTSFNLVAAQQPQNYINNYIGIQLDYPASWVHFDSTQFPYVFFFPANEYQSDVFPTLQSVSFAVSKDWTISEQDLTLESYLQQAKTHFQIQVSLIWENLNGLPFVTDFLLMNGLLKVIKK